MSAEHTTEVTVTLSDRVALVTGASRGIGREVAVALARAGARVGVNYRKNDEDAAAVVAEIEAAGGRAHAVRADVSVRAEVHALVVEVESRLGPVDVLINNAGIAQVADLDQLTEEDFDRTLAINLKSAFLCTQAVLAGMRARGWGRIVNVSSAAARGAGVVGVHYNASKAGMEGLTRGYAARLAADGITVNAVAPGPIETDMSADLVAAGRFGHLTRLGTAAEVAHAVRMVVENGLISGQTIAVNGGMLFT